MITIEGVSKKFGPTKVLSAVSLIIPDGGCTVVMGPNGSGKTTLMNLVLGLLAPDEGRIVGAAGTRKAAVFQEDRLCEHLSAISNLRLVVQGRVGNPAIRDELSRSGLPVDAMTKPVSELSGGQRRRVAIARAMLAEGDLVCLDEPFEGLDPQTKESVMDYVGERTRGKSVLLITHDSAEAQRFGGEVVHLPGA